MPHATPLGQTGYWVSSLWPPEVKSNKFEQVWVDPVDLSCGTHKGNIYLLILSSNNLWKWHKQPSFEGKYLWNWNFFVTKLCDLITLGREGEFPWMKRTLKEFTSELKKRGLKGCLIYFIYNYLWSSNHTKAVLRENYQTRQNFVCMKMKFWKNHVLSKKKEGWGAGRLIILYFLLSHKGYCTFCEYTRNGTNQIYSIAFYGNHSTYSCHVDRN